MPESVLHYTILEKLGEGGMGMVYLAEDKRLNRKVALKFLPRHVALNEAVQQRFMQEARSAAILNHQNIAQVHAVEEADGRVFIVMEYVEGEDLNIALERNEYTDEEKLSIARQIAEGLSYAHKNKIIHRDIKSGNIRVRNDGIVKIMDFGLARLEGSEHLTKEGTTLGTTSYMAPEQFRGVEADSRSDIWAFGVVLFEIFAKKLPFEGAYEQAVIYSITEEDPADLRELSPGTPEHVIGIVELCLQKDREVRYQSMAEVLHDLSETNSPGNPVGKKKAESLLKTPALAVSVIVLMIALTVIYAVQSGFFTFGDSGIKQKYLAVLPVEFIGEETNFTAICDGLAETLSYKLSEIEQFENEFWVTPAGEMRNENVTTATQASEKFGVTLAVISSMQVIGDSTRLTIELVDAEKARRIGVRRVMVEKGDFFKLEREGVRALLSMMNIEVSTNINQTLSEDTPENPKAYEHYLRGLAALNKGDAIENLDQAREHFNRSVEADRNFALGYAGLGKVDLEMYDTVREAEYLRSAERSVSNSVQLNDSLAHIKTLLGDIKALSGDNEEAISQYYGAINLDPKYSDAYSGMASVYFETGEHEIAEQTYLQAIRLKPGYWQGYKELGTFYYMTGEIEKAIVQFEKVTQLTPRNSQAYSNLGGVYIAAGQPERARVILEKALAIDNNIFAASNLAYLYYYEGLFEESAMMYELAVDEYPSRYDLRANLGSAYNLSEEKDKAREAYLAAIELAKEELKVNSADAGLHADLGSYYSDVGNEEMAKQYIEEALSIDADDPEVRYRAVSAYTNLGEIQNALKWLTPEMLQRVEGEPELRNLVASEEYQQWKGMMDIRNTNE